MKIALFSNPLKSDIRETNQAVKAYLARSDIQTIELVPDEQTVKARATDIDFYLIIGGDGTILRFLHTYTDIDAPILGINQGGLGFMADVPVEDLIPCLEDLICKKFSIQSRKMLQLKLGSNHTCRALNEVIFHRGRNSGVIELSLSIDDRIVNTFSGDGLIIATPNGSTAYSLSAGGPIVAPELSALLVTPICPHTISHRSLVLPATSRFDVQIISSKEPVEIAIDGFAHSVLQRGESAKIIQNDTSFRWVNLHRCDYFASLRSKLAWSGTLKNRS